MGILKGQFEYKKWEEGKNLTRKESILANCYVCNGLEQSGVDCKGYRCPLYQYHPNKGK